jgi:hypothetical protein
MIVGVAIGVGKLLPISSLLAGVRKIETIIVRTNNNTVNAERPTKA